ncbi:hypothetical protein AB0I93_05500 [Streptomyces sp. NPDC049967]|uniref:hypothetical protein n=1 Tax=unclassified Streptomyces TaxID=2593676 RepID=UPI002E133355|nr:MULTISPECIES: hypothetical protein [unclassified Streptomyces]WSJ26833.1 hypothetical protein OG384_35010 [Streptomyces sp. NBC_01324]
MDIDAVNAADVLHEMVRCGVLTAGPDGFGFCHPLVRASFQAVVSGPQSPDGDRERAKAPGVAGARRLITEMG